MATAAAGRIAMLLGTMSALRRRVYSAFGIGIMGRWASFLSAVTALVQRRLSRDRFSGFLGLGEQQQRRDAQVFHDFHVVAFTVFGLFQGILHLRDGGQVLQHFL